MRRVLCGLDTEFGFSVEGRGAADQIEDAKALVRSFPGERIAFWDDRFESPRSDLRGFKLTSLSFDPEDAKFDEGKSHGTVSDVRSDLVLANGARFYNDHGHPEYATPETWSLHELVALDRQGEQAVVASAAAFAAQAEREVRVYKNNTDFHGASYGTHESYLVPRSVPIDDLVLGLMPVLVARQVLCGAGKVGAEQGARCDYQISQRADFFAEPINAETLYRRPVFNTRDEPHADPAQWIRLHVICGESNMIATSTLLKVALVKCALALIESRRVPTWRLTDPVRAIKTVSRDTEGEGRIELEGRSWTTPRQVIESYIEPFLLSHAQEDEELTLALQTALRLLEARFSRPQEFARSVDWAAKRALLSEFINSEGLSWRDPSIQSLDLEYHRLDGEGGLFHGLLELGAVDPDPAVTEEHAPKTRAFARSLAVTKFREDLVNVSWGTLTLRTDRGERTVALPPDKLYSDTLVHCKTVEEFIMELERDDR